MQFQLFNTPSAPVCWILHNNFLFRCSDHAWHGIAGGFINYNKNHGGQPPILSWVQMFQLYKVASGENPLQYKVEFALWTIEIVSVYKVSAITAAVITLML
jgi:hypothetical protein